MRLPGIVIGFSVGAFMMWRIAVPDVVSGVCVNGSDCDAASRVRASMQATPAPPGLRIVVYDPGVEADAFRAGPTTPLAPTSAMAPVPGPAFQRAALTRVRRRCATVMEPGCVKFVNPGDQTGLRLPGPSVR